MTESTEENKRRKTGGEHSQGPLDEAGRRRSRALRLNETRAAERKGERGTAVDERKRSARVEREKKRNWR